MNAKERLIIAGILVLGTILNFMYPVAAAAVSFPIGIEFVIVAYCLVVMLVPLRLPEVIGIGITAGILNIISNPAHVATIVGGGVSTPAGFMALFNLASEPAGILVCFFTFAYLKGRLRFTAPLAAAFMATLASGFAYLLLVFLFNPALPESQPEFLGMFLNRVAVAAVANAVVVQVFFMIAEHPVKAYLEIRSG